MFFIVVVLVVAVVVLAVAVVVVVVAVAVRCRLLLFLLTLRSISGFRFFRSCFYDFLFANALPVPCYNRSLSFASFLCWFGGLALRMTGSAGSAGRFNVKKIM